MTRPAPVAPRLADPAAADRLRGRRRGVLLIAAVGAIVVALAAGDVVTRSVLEHRIAATIERRLDAAGGPDATVTARVGAPSALLGLLGVPIGGVRLDIAVPVAELGDLLSAGANSPHDASGPTISVDGGLLVVTTAFRSGGSSAPLAVELRPQVSDGALILVPVAVRVAGTTFAVDLLAERGNLAHLTDPRPVDLSALPDGVHLTGARVEGARLVLQAQLDDVDVGGSGPP